MRGLREAVEGQLGVQRPDHVEVPPEACERFADDLPDELAPAARKELLDRAEELQPWLQGPFWLGGDLVIGGTWRNDQRWVGLAGRVPDDLTGTRVLDVGSNAGYDPFMFRRRGAEVLAAEPFQFIEQARFLEGIYRTGVDFQQLRWEDLDPAAHGTFDLVHCHGVLYHERHPMGLLERLRAMTADGGALLFGSMMLASPDLAEYARFVPGAYYGDPTWWWVPGRLCMRWMLEACGFEVQDEFAVHDGPPGEFPVVNGYFSARPAGG
jgi:tRNA (mo5U34)-methyltransferase